MSSWIGDWERSLIPGRSISKAARERGKYRTQCKLGRHAVMENDPARWVTDATLAPLGLSCVPCLQAKAAELGVTLDLAEPAPPRRKVPHPRSAADPANWVHGRFHTYSVHKCRCVPCGAANTERSRQRRERLRQEKAASA